MTDDTGVTHSRGKSRRSTPQAPIIGTASATLAMFNVGGNPWPATPGQDYTGSVWLRHNSAVAANIQVGLQFLDSGGGSLYHSLGPLTLGVAPNTWARASHVYTAPVGTVTMRVTAYLYRQSGTIQAGEVAWVDDCLVEASSSLDDYFDGATPDTSSRDYAWAGAADASQSIQTGITQVTGGLPASLTWDEATCLGPPLDVGRWNDQPASLRWDQITPTTTWDTY